MKSKNSYYANDILPLYINMFKSWVLLQFAVFLNIVIPVLEKIVFIFIDFLFINVIDMISKFWLNIPDHFLNVNSLLFPSILYYIVSLGKVDQFLL